MKRTLMVNPSECTNCHICELACSFRHGNMFTLSKSRIYTIHDPKTELTIPVLCLQCEEAACVLVCPSGALQMNSDTGAIEINRGLCVSCHACVAACPFGNIMIDEDDPKTVFKCDLCGGEPVCARFCPTDALVYM